MSQAAHEREQTSATDRTTNEIPNEDLAATIEEGNAIIDGRIKTKGYSSVEELFNALGI